MVYFPGTTVYVHAHNALFDVAQGIPWAYIQCVCAYGRDQYTSHIQYMANSSMALS